VDSLLCHLRDSPATATCQASQLNWLIEISDAHELAASNIVLTRNYDISPIEFELCDLGLQWIGRANHPGGRSFPKPEVATPTDGIACPGPKIAIRRTQVGSHAARHGSVIASRRRAGFFNLPPAGFQSYLFLTISNHCSGISLSRVTFFMCTPPGVSTD